jgi:chorismate mutase/prephenate dehydrogenase
MSAAQGGERSIEELRDAIGRVDAELVGVLARRMALVREVGKVKAASGLPVLDPAREAAVVSRAAAMARDAGLPEDDVRMLFWQLMAISRRVQGA